jgi:endonuclease/exonuclease/phosphatase family metal-dependent hydrolase
VELKLISCNIRFDNPSDGDHCWNRRRELLATTLLRHDPDVIATQEGRYQQLIDLLSLLPGYQLVDEHRCWIKERMYPSFYVKKNRFEIFPGEDLWLSETPGVAGSLSFNSAFPRLMTWIRLQPRDGQESLLLINTHLDHIEASTRENQMQVLTQELLRFWNRQWPLTVMGDFNDAPESSVRQILLDSVPDLQDAWKLFNTDEESSHHAFTGEMQNGSRIDWILVDQKLQVLECLMDKSHQQGLYPTDHFPIVCKIKL